MRRWVEGTCNNIGVVFAVCVAPLLAVAGCLGTGVVGLVQTGVAPLRKCKS